MCSETSRYRARWIFPVTGQPVRDGTIRIERGRIAAVYADRDTSAVDLGQVAIIPGLVNAHTHLDLSDLPDRLVPQEPFSQWLRGVIAHRRDRPTGSDDAIGRGCRQSRHAGTTLIGEIATDDYPAGFPAVDEPRIVAFRELIGLGAANIDAQLESARRYLEAAAVPAGADIVRGVGPHAPYSVHPDLFGKLVELAAKFRAPLAVHLAETPAELELLERQTGDLYRFLCDLGVWEPGVIAMGTRPLDYLRPLANLDRALVVHGNYLADEELEFLARHPQLTVVYCPRTHAYFRHDAHPWKELLSRGGSVALGTDSRASNPDLSVWNELLFLRERHPDGDAAMLLKLATLDGARALGQAEFTGSLDLGKSADLAVVSLAAASGKNAYEDLLQSANRVVAAMRSGRWIAGRGDRST